MLLNKSDLTAVIEKEEMEQKTGASGHQHFRAGRDGYGRAGGTDEKDVFPGRNFVQR